MEGRNKNIGGIILLFCIVIPFLYNIVIFKGEAGEPFLEMPKNEKCIKDAKYIRFNHFLLLKNERDRVVRKGGKTEINFNNCRRCHIHREKFCNRCHKMANVAPLCFSCHYYP